MNTSNELRNQIENVHAVYTFTGNFIMYQGFSVLDKEGREIWLLSVQGRLNKIAVC